MGVKKTVKSRSQKIQKGKARAHGSEAGTGKGPEGGERLLRWLVTEVIVLRLHYRPITRIRNWSGGGGIGESAKPSGGEGES